jgi:ABC-type transporter Mla subunit MlaD
MQNNSETQNSGTKLMKTQTLKQTLKSLKQTLKSNPKPRNETLKSLKQFSGDMQANLQPKHIIF